VSSSARLSDGSSVFKSIEADEGLLSQRAAEQIEELIRLGKLSAGDRLPSERELSEQLGVSRTVVREAIKLLRAAGLVRVRMGVGSFITVPSRNILEGPLSRLSAPGHKLIQDLIQVRDAIEPPIAALAAQNATDEDIAKLAQALDEMERDVSNPGEYIVADNAFHFALAEAAQNSVFQLIANSIVDLLQESRRLAVSSPGAVKRANYHHRHILEAVKAGDIDGAYMAMDEHMHQIRDDIEIGLGQQVGEDA